jgi:hypothetical protein
MSTISEAFTMVRRHGKRQAYTREGKKEKRERGECSTRIGGLGLHAPKRRRGEEQRVETPTLGSPSFCLLFKFNCIDLGR